MEAGDTVFDFYTALFEKVSLDLVAESLWVESSVRAKFLEFDCLRIAVSVEASRRLAGCVISATFSGRRFTVTIPSHC